MAGKQTIKKTTTAAVDTPDVGYVTRFNETDVEKFRASSGTVYNLMAFAAGAIVANSLLIGTAADTLTPTTFAANTFPARAGTGNLVAKTITDFGLSLVDDADAATARTTLGLGSSSTLNVDTDGTMAANSDTVVPSQKAVRTYVGTAVTGLLDFQGSTDCSGNPNYPAASKGDAYVVSVAGKIGGAAGTAVDVGDVYFAIADNAGGTQAAVGSSWDILEHNLQGALLSANNLSDIASASTARTNLGVTATGADTTYAFRANNLSDLANAGTALTNLGGTTVGKNFFTLANPSAITFPQINADNTITTNSASDQRTSLGLGTIATQDASNVSITGGAITGTTFNSGVIGGVTPAAITGTSVTATGSVFAATQTSGNTSFTATTDTDTGIGLQGSNVMTLISAGSNVVLVGAGGLRTVGINTTPTVEQFKIAGTWANATPGNVGSVFSLINGTVTDNVTAGSGTAANFAVNTFGAPTLAASNTLVTTTTASTLRIASPPIAGTNQTIGTSSALRIPSGTLTGTISLSYGVYSVASTGAATNYAGYFGGSDASTESLVVASRTVAIVAGDLVGGIAFQSADTNLTNPATVGSFQAKATQTHTGSNLGTQFLWRLVPNSSTTIATVMTLDQDGSLTLTGNLTMADGKDFIINATTGSKIGQAGSKIGAYGVTPVVRPSAFTQTYSTATHTIAARAASAITDNSGGVSGYPTIAVVTNPTLAWNGILAPTAADATAINTAITALKAAVAALAVGANNGRSDDLSNVGCINAIIDDMQSIGWLQ